MSLNGQALIKFHCAQGRRREREKQSVFLRGQGGLMAGSCGRAAWTGQPGDGAESTAPRQWEGHMPCPTELRLHCLLEPGV